MEPGGRAECAGPGWNLSNLKNSKKIRNPFRHAPTLRMAADDEKQLGVYAERLGGALHLAPAKASGGKVGGSGERSRARLVRVLGQVGDLICILGSFFPLFYVLFLC